MNLINNYNYNSVPNISDQINKLEQFGWIEISRSPVAKGLSIAELKAKYLNPLQASVSLNDLDLCKKILDLTQFFHHQLNKSKTDLSLSDIDPTSKVLFQAIENNNVQIVKLLLEKGANITNFDFSENNPAGLAFLNRNKEILKIFIEKGFKLDLEILPGIPLAFMDKEDNSVKSMRMALELGADIHHRFSDGMTYLHLAAKKGDLPLCKFLIEAGADIKAVDQNKQNVLSMAIINPDLVPFFLEKGADAQTIDGSGKSILEMFEVLKDSAVAVNALRAVDKGWTPLIKSLRLMGLRHNLQGKIFEGSDSHFGYERLAYSLEGYLLTEKTAHSISKTIPDRIARASKINYKEVLTRLENDEIVTLSCGWHKHETVAILTKEFIMLGNRGDESGNEPGLTLYKINKPENLKEALKTLIKNRDPLKEASHLPGKQIQKFLIEKTKESKFFFNKKILDLLDLKRIYHLRQKSQTSGNCTWMASKMGLIGNLIFSCLQENPERNLDDIVKESKRVYRDWKKYDWNRTFESLKEAEENPKIKNFIDLEKIYDELFILNFFNPQMLDTLCALHPRLKEWVINPDRKLISYAYQQKNAKLVRKLLEMGAEVDMQAFSLSDYPKLDQVHYDYFFEKWIQDYKTNPSKAILLHQLCTISTNPDQLLGLLKDWKQKLDKMKEPDLLKNALNTPLAIEQGGYTPLQGIIAKCNDLSAVQDLVAFMIKIGADPSAEAKDQSNAILYAVNKVAKRKDIEVVQTLLEAVKQPSEVVNKANLSDVKPLDTVPFGKDYSAPLIRVLLNAGAEVPTEYLDNSEMDSEVMASLVDYYILKGIEQNKPDEEGYTPLYYVVDTNLFLATKLLESWHNRAEETGNKDQVRQAIQELMPNGEAVLDLEILDQWIQEDKPGVNELKAIFLQCTS